MHTADLPFSAPASSAPVPPEAAAEALVEGVSAMLRVARGLLEGRRQVDLAGLDATVGYLCARALDLPPEHGRALRPRLVLLVAELDGLTSALAQP